MIRNGAVKGGGKQEIFTQLYQGDCLTLMRDIPDGSVDMILCDLPYGTTHCKWDAVIPFEPLWEQYKRIAKKNAAIVLFAAQPFTTDVINSTQKMFRYDIVWRKNAPTGFLNANRMPLRAHESILVFYRRLPTYHPQKRKGKPYTKSTPTKTKLYNEYDRLPTINNGDRYPISVVDFATCNTTKDKPVYPTQKPVPLLEYLIRTYTNEGETVLDNCMGSGSTGVACLHTGRNFIGMEKDSDYFTIAERRITAARR